jgi:Membrane fusion protein Use1
LIFRARIAEQRKRVLELYEQVTLAQQRLANVSEEEEELDEQSPMAPVEVPAEESTATLRNQLFENHGEKEVDTSTEHVLQHHRMLQDDLSDAMLGMARGLKERSIAFGEALREDSKVAFPWPANPVY